MLPSTLNMRGSALLLDRCQVARRPDRDLHSLRLLQWRCAGTDSVGRCLAGSGSVKGGRSHRNDVVRVRLGTAGWRPLAELLFLRSRRPITRSTGGYFCGEALRFCSALQH
jgi:hypothetical protein